MATAWRDGQSTLKRLEREWGRGQGQTERWSRPLGSFGRTLPGRENCVAWPPAESARQQSAAELARTLLKDGCCFVISFSLTKGCLMRSVSSLVVLVAMIVSPLVAVSACSKDDGSANRSTSPGPAERAGAKVDETAHDAKEGVKEGAARTGEAARGAASAAGSAVERAGEKIQGKP